MKKLSMKVDALRVETFEPVPAGEEPKGTVAANEATLQTCPRIFTCGATCGGDTCEGGFTCDGGSQCPNTYYATCIPYCTGSIEC